MVADFVSADEVMRRLGIDREELDNLIEGGGLTVYAQNGKEAFDDSEVVSLKKSSRFAPEAEIAKALPEDEGISLGETVVDDAGLGLGETVLDEEGDLFDFADELDTELVAESAPGAETETEEAAEPVEEEELEESDMITEVVDVGKLGEEDEDILGDIIEDVETGPAPVEAAGREDAFDMETSQEPTGDITDLGEETEDTMAGGEDEPTAEATEEEAAFGEEELEEILTGEEEFMPDEEAGFEVPYGAPVTTPAEASVPAWVAVVLVLALLVQVLGALFVIENGVSPRHNTPLTGSLNLFKSK